ncbi:MAG TPA: class I SAM-dependent methyltransferase [Rhizomicrobium sp.]|jgi:2-polyprenyl-3-methyl-5-hydroxy-6-metoxy-1,4-benzoquinol methylase|nr:class I SAM-dependent methyltransferase [Rhizomicrobium sp.]
MDLKEEEILGDQVGSHWYYRAKAGALHRDLRHRMPREILDIGAGSGFFSRVLLKETSAERAVCVDTGYAGSRDEVWCGKPIAFRRSIERSDADLVLAMDVMEHVADDAALMRSYSDLVAPGTRFIVSVPAFNFLWSSHDVFLEHHRRYTLGNLKAALRAAGLVVDWCHYYYAAVFPLAAAMRLLEHMKKRETVELKSQLQQHSPLVNGTLSTLLAMERPVMGANKLFGLTAFAGCHKP